MQTPGLRLARQRAMLTQAELALAAKVSRATVARMEAGEVARFVTIRRIAKALRIEPAELMGTVIVDTSGRAHRDR